MPIRLLIVVLTSVTILLQGYSGGPSGPSSLHLIDTTPPATPPPTTPTPSKHNDRVLADLIAHGGYVGNYSAGRSYSIGDVVLYAGKFYFCYADTKAANSPDTTHFDLLPLIDSEALVVDDSFDYKPGPLSGRHTVEGVAWGITGVGYLNAYVDSSGFLTSSRNTYYLLQGLPSPITEFGLVQSTLSAPTTATMAISHNKLFSEMWHVNWYDWGVGQSHYWHNGAAAVPATYKFKYNAGLVYRPGSPHEMVLKIRGKFLFGYLDGKLAFIHLSDMIGTLTANANAVYAQNHSPIANEEKVERIWIKTKTH